MNCVYKTSQMVFSAFRNASKFHLVIGNVKVEQAHIVERAERAAWRTSSHHVHISPCSWSKKRTLNYLQRGTLCRYRRTLLNWISPSFGTNQDETLCLQLFSNQGQMLPVWIPNQHLCPQSYRNFQCQDTESSGTFVFTAFCAQCQAKGAHSSFKKTANCTYCIDI